MWWKKKKSPFERQLKELKSKAHFIPSLGVYAYVGWDYQVTLAESNISNQSINMIYAAIEHYRKVAAVYDETQRAVEEREIWAWTNINETDVKGVYQYLASELSKLKKKAEEVARQSGMTEL